LGSKKKKNKVAPFYQMRYGLSVAKSPIDLSGHKKIIEMYGEEINSKGVETQIICQELQTKQCYSSKVVPDSEEQNIHHLVFSVPPGNS